MCRINLSSSVSDIPDWDDNMKSVHWVNRPPSSNAPATNSTVEDDSTIVSFASKSTGAVSRKEATPAKKKVVEIEKEPSHTVMEGSIRDLVLSVNGVIDYVKYGCPIESVMFKDTLMYQTRAYTFPLKNTGKTYLEFDWSIWKEDGSSPTPPPSQLQLDGEGCVVSEGGEVLPFSVSPTSGIILPGDEAQITARFSPLDVMEASYLLLCQLVDSI